MTLLPFSARQVAGIGQQLFMGALPHGGQRLARRNAWAGMSADAAVGRARREANQAMDRALDRAAGLASVRVADGH